MSAVITAFANSPDRGRGLARDMRVRWAFEEVGQSYDVRLLPFEALKQPAHLALQPFGQIPTYEDGVISMFETGAIVLHIAQQHSGLLPQDDRGRAKAISWMFAALNTIEPPVLERESAGFEEREENWHQARLPIMDARIRLRLRQLSAAMNGADWLDGGFSAGDLLMISVLRRLEGSDILSGFPDLVAYVARGTDRPAYRRAFAAQLSVFEALSRT